MIASLHPLTPTEAAVYKPRIGNVLRKGVYTKTILLTTGPFGHGEGCTWIERCAHRHKPHTERQGYSTPGQFRRWLIGATVVNGGGEYKLGMEAQKRRRVGAADRP